MAATVAAASVSQGKNPEAPVFTDIVPITGGNPYTVGGEDIDALIKARIGAGRTILSVEQVPSYAGGGPWKSSYVLATGKLMLLDATGAEVGAIDTSSFAAVPHRVISY